MTLEEVLRNYPIMRDYVQVGRVEKKDGKSLILINVLIRKNSKYYLWINPNSLGIG